jgi:putative N-acetyltransferase (TIGR04045 family)
LSAVAVAEAFLATMGGPRPTSRAVLVEQADAAGLRAHRALRHAAFVVEQGLFVDHDLDDADAAAGTVVLVAREASGLVVGGVRLHAHPEHADIGWWHGSRLVVAPGASPTVAPTLVRAATATARARGALRFDATVQPTARRLFERLGWTAVDAVEVNGAEHLLMVAGDDRVGRALEELKRPLGRLFAGRAPGVPGFVGDDASPVPGTGVVAACDAVLPQMVERDPWWAGWCSVLVNVNDLAAMGAEPIGLLDAVAARSEAHAADVLAGLHAAADAYDVPVLGGHTQLGQHASLTVTALGRAEHVVPGGGGRPGDVVSLTADLTGSWRPGYAGRQWDSTTARAPEDLRDLVGVLRHRRPAAAKDVSMAGTLGTLAMLAEASGTGAELDVAAVPRPRGVGTADWLGCFPGFALLTADRPGADRPRSGAAVTRAVGRLTSERGTVRLRWPDGRSTVAVAGAATGLGAA